MPIPHETPICSKKSSLLTAEYSAGIRLAMTVKASRVEGSAQWFVLVSAGSRGFFMQKKTP